MAHRGSASSLIRRAATAAAFFALVTFPTQGNAQGAADSDIARANRLVEDAIRLASRGDTAAALDRLERATKLASGLAEAHYRRGMLLARQSGTDLGDMFQRRRAQSALARAIRIDGGNPYYFLELGRLRLKQGFMRLDAQRLFNRALRAARERGDPAVVAEIEGELGDIYFRRYQAVGHRRLITGDVFRFDTRQALGNTNYAREFLAGRSYAIPDAGELDLRQAEEHYRAGVAAWSGHDKATAGLLGILYDGARYEEYHETARNFVRAAPNNARAHLFYGLGLWKLGRGREATRAFRRALDMMPPADRARLTDLSLIMRRSDAEAYGNLTSADRAEYNRIYWSANDPLKLTEWNEHQLEHLARVAYTDIRFSAPELRMRGWESDRGVIYIRYGPPPVIATFPPGTSQMGTLTDPIVEGGRGVVTGDVMATGRITTVWFYPERNLRFVFYGPPGYNFARFAGEFQAYAEDARYALPVKYDNVPVNEALDSVAIQAAAFRATDTTSATELVIFAGLPLRRMTEGVDLDEGPLESGLFISDLLERSIDEQRRNETVEFRAERQFEQRTFVSYLLPGEYRFRVEARQPTTRRAARGAARVAIETFDRPIFMLSDVVLADRIAPREDVPGGRGAFFMDPNPAMTYAPGDEVHLYWEMYNLTPDSTGAVSYRAEVVIMVQSLERTGFAANIVGGIADAIGTSARGDDQVTLSYDVSDVLGDRDRLPGWVALDLSDAPNGTYILDLSITDQQTGQTATRRRTFRVTESGQ